MYENYTALEIERRDAVLTIRIDNPPMNAITPAAHAELARIFFDINTDPDTKVVVITGAGDRAFCGGGDIGEMIRRVETKDIERWNEVAAEAKQIVEGLLKLERPLIARINGHAMGLGATLASFADVSYMLADAKIADSHVKMGLSAGDGGSLLWPLLIGFPKARLHLLTGDAMTGSEAAEAGLITESCATLDELDTKVDALAARLAAGATRAINATKMSINLVLRNAIENLIDAHMAHETATFESEDHRVAVTAFRDKQTPKFTGK